MERRTGDRQRNSNYMDALAWEVSSDSDVMSDFLDK